MIHAAFFANRPKGQAFCKAQALPALAIGIGYFPSPVFLGQPTSTM